MTTNKAGFAGILNRLFIIVLLFTFVVTAGSFVLRHTISVKLDRLSSQLAARSSHTDVSALLIDLDLAENNFQKANANGTRADLALYQHRMDTIFAGLAKTIDHYRESGDTSLHQSRQELSKRLQEKLDLSRHLFDLRKNFDSLLRITTYERMHVKPVSDSKPPVEKPVTDTLVSTRMETSKNSLLKRLKEALHTTQSVKVMTIREKQALSKEISGADAKRRLSKLGSEYRKWSESGQSLVLANLNLLTELRQLISQLDDIDRIAYEKSRENILHEYASATRDLNTFTGIASVAVLLFITLLLVYIRRAGWAERRLRVESNRAIRLAGQKSEILAIMSHEIRNRLMAINGAVFMLKRTKLSPEQDQKINAINLSSDLVMETVNNVLDVSKLEQKQIIESRSEAFSPGKTIADAVEAMRFMAENKGISLLLEQDTPPEAEVSGDSFKLKQTLLNLISNSIKYTEVGQVLISSRLETEQTGYRLTVKVKDSGVGIPKNKQAQLFSPYYQAGGNKPGTGLGLYLCRQLIRSMGGDISLQSAEGAGCTVNFWLPFASTAAGECFPVIAEHHAGDPLPVSKPKNRT